MLEVIYTIGSVSLLVSGLIACLLAGSCLFFDRKQDGLDWIVQVSVLIVGLGLLAVGIQRFC